MGCIGSHLAQFTSNSGHIHRSRQNVFSVLNVDEMGRNLQTGKLEVTETDLVLYVRGKSALTWPLRCLRRYGYDEDLFSFESGRRCPSGPGIYAFKCHRAQSLFNLLQAKIQGNPTALPPVPITPTPLNSASLSPTFDYVNISDQNNRGTIITTTMTTTTTTNTTTSLTAAATTTTHDQDGIDNTSTSQITQISQDNNHPLYMNVENHNPTNNVPHHRQSNSSQKNGPTSSTSRLRNYSCNGTFFTDYPCGALSNTNNSVYYSNVDCSLMQTTTTSSNAINNEVNNVSAAEVNYAELDLETDSKVTTMNSTTIAFNSMNHTKVSRLSTLGGSFGDDRFRAKIKTQIDPLTLTTTTTHDDDDDSIFSSVDTSTVPCGNSSSVVAVLNTNNIISSAGAPVSSNNNNGSGPAAGYATIDFNRTAALSEIRNQLVNNRSNCNP